LRLVVSRRIRANTHRRGADAALGLFASVQAAFLDPAARAGFRLSWARTYLEL
jgi:hypothetical protein